MVFTAFCSGNFHIQHLHIMISVQLQGHDAAFESIAKGKAKMCFLTTDASERLKEEFKETVRYKGRQVPLKELDCTMREIQMATGQKCAVFTVTDAGFASKLTELLSKEDKD